MTLQETVGTGRDGMASHSTSTASGNGYIALSRKTDVAVTTAVGSDRTRFVMSQIEREWTNLGRLPGAQNCRDGRGLRASVQIAVWVLGHSKLHRRHRPRRLLVRR